MQATIRHNLTNHSRGFITGAQVHNAFKAQTRKEMLAASRFHKKTISKARHQRRPVMSEFINTEAHVSPQIKSANQLGREDELEEEFDMMIFAGDINGRKRPPTRAEPLLPFLQ
tara:strand:+ start:1337 stop:1678 length:342 start_codon:yes stop_codon:yes gene_type:complete